MGERTARWLSTLSGIFAVYIALGIVYNGSIVYIWTWPLIFFAWSVFIKILTFLMEGNGEYINAQWNNEGISEQRASTISVPKDRRISSYQPDSGTIRTTSRIIGQVAERSTVHTKETRERNSYPGDPDGNRASRDFADFLRST